MAQPFPGKSSAISGQRTIWFLWLLAVGAIFLLNCWTLALSPVTFEDEVQIVDLGRTTLPGADLTWGLQWSSPGRAAQPLMFLGPALQELAFRSFNYRIFGARLSAMIGLLLASAAFLGWMLAVQVSPIVALFGSLLLLVEPTLTQGVRGGRIDALAIFFVFLACWTIAASCSKPATIARIRVAAAGFCLGLSLLVWPTAAITFPIVLYALWDRNHSRTVASIAVTAAILAIGTIGTVLIAVACLAEHGAQAIADLRAGVANTASVSLASAAMWWDGVRSLFANLKSSPWLIPWAFLGILFQRRWLFLSLTAITIVGAIATRVYFYRTTYVIPILLVACIVTSHTMLKGLAHRRNHPFPALLAGGLLITALGVGLALLGARTYIALKERNSRDPSIVLALSESAIGPGPRRVYIGPWEFYAPGRKLGWRMYRDGTALRQLNWTQMPDSLDFAILQPTQIPGIIDSELKAHGFVETRIRPDLPIAQQTLAVEGKNYDHEYFLFSRPGVRTPP